DVSRHCRRSALQKKGPRQNGGVLNPSREATTGIGASLGESVALPEMAASPIRFPLSGVRAGPSRFSSARVGIAKGIYKLYTSSAVVPYLLNLPLRSLDKRRGAEGAGRLLDFLPPFT